MGGEPPSPPEKIDILTQAEMQEYLDWWVYDSFILSDGEVPLPPEKIDILTEAEMQEYLDWWVYDSFILSMGGEPPLPPEKIDILTQAEMQEYLDWWVYDSFISMAGGEPFTPDSGASGEIGIIDDIVDEVKSWFTTPCYPLKAGDICCESSTTGRVAHTQTPTDDPPICQGIEYHVSPICESTDSGCCRTTKTGTNCEKR